MRPRWTAAIQTIVRTAVTLLLLGSLFACCGTAYTMQSTHRIHPPARVTYSAILMWHDVVRDRKEVWFDVTVKELEAQLAEIKRRKFNVISLEELYGHLAHGRQIPPRSLVITFDDTTMGIYRYAYPMLKRYGYPATLFIHTDYVGVKTGKDHFTWEQMKEMQASGLISIQSHTRSHPADLRKLGDAHLEKEVRGSREIIEKRLGTRVFAFAYTEGGHDSRVRKAVAAAGYKLAMGEDWGSAESSPDLIRLNRYTTHRRWAQALNDVDRAHRAANRRSPK